MTVTLTFRNSSIPDAVFTGATYSIANGIVEVTGTDANGTVGTFSFHWDDVFRVAAS